MVGEQLLRVTLPTTVLWLLTEWAVHDDVVWGPKSTVGAFAGAAVLMAPLTTAVVGARTQQMSDLLETLGSTGGRSRSTVLVAGWAGTAGPLVAAAMVASICTAFLAWASPLPYSPPVIYLVSGMLAALGASAIGWAVGLLTPIRWAPPLAGLGIFALSYIATVVGTLGELNRVSAVAPAFSIALTETGMISSSWMVAHCAALASLAGGAVAASAVVGALRSVPVMAAGAALSALSVAAICVVSPPRSMNGSTDIPDLPATCETTGRLEICVHPAYANLAMRGYVPPLAEMLARVPESKVETLRLRQMEYRPYGEPPYRSSNDVIELDLLAPSFDLTADGRTKVDILSDVGYAILADPADPDACAMLGPGDESRAAVHDVLLRLLVEGHVDEAYFPPGSPLALAATRLNEIDSAGRTTEVLDAMWSRIRGCRLDEDGLVRLIEEWTT